MALPLSPAPALPPLAAIGHTGILLAGVAAAAIPIIIHLLNRRRVQPHAWAAMTWLLAAVRRHQRRLRMENWLVLLLRALALLLLGVGLARVVVSDSALDVFVRPRRSFVLLLDTSYSTGARDGSRSVSERIQSEAEKVLAGVSGDDVVAVVVSNDVRSDRAGTRPEVLVPRAVGADGVRRAKEALSTIRPTEAKASWAEAIAAAAPRVLLQEGDPNRTLVWITDLQATDWGTSDPGSGGDGPGRPARDGGGPDGVAPGGRSSVGGVEAMAAALEAVRRSGADIRILDANGAPGRSLSNLAVVDVRLLASSDVFQRQPFKLLVRVANYGERAISNAAIRVFLDDRATPAAQAVVPPLPAAHAAPLLVSDQTVEVDIKRDAAFATAGGHSVRVEIVPPDADADSDALALDSRRVLALDVRSKLHVAAWMQRGRDARWDPTAQAQGVFVGDDGRDSDTFSFRSVATEEDLSRLLGDPAAELDLLILANRVPRGAGAVERIAAFVRGGGALLVFVGDEFESGAWNRAFHDDPATRLLPFTFGPIARRDRVDPKGAIASLEFEHPTSHPISAAFASDKMAWVRDVPLRLYGVAPLVPDPRKAAAPGEPTPVESIVFRFQREPGSEGPGAIAAVEGVYERGLGRSMWFGMGLDDAWNPNVVFPFLPVFLNDVALYLTQRPAAGRNIEVGQLLRALVPSEATDIRLSVPGRGGATERLTPRAAASEFDRREVVYDRVGTTGVWSLAYAMPPIAGSGSEGPRTVTDVVSVSPTPSEGCLLRAPRADVEERSRVADAKVLDGWTEGVAERAKGDEGEITRPILFAVLAILLLEPFLAMRFGRHDSRGAAPGKGPS